MYEITLTPWVLLGLFLISFIVSIICASQITTPDASYLVAANYFFVCSIFAIVTYVFHNMKEKFADVANKVTNLDIKVGSLENKVTNEELFA